MTEPLTQAEPTLSYLDHLLGPLAAWLARGDVTDLYINRPGELWVETLDGTVEPIPCSELTAKMLDRLARQIAAASAQGVNRESPILSATLPDGARVQIVLPPATRHHPALAIRKHLVMDRRLGDYEREGAFGLAATQAAHDDDLRAALENSGPAKALSLAVRQRRNILISGGTSTGKSTFLNALIAEIPAAERLIVIEDTPELQLRHDNVVGLLATRSALGEARVSAEDLLNASLRMRPDRIILGEIRGPEAFTFLRAVNTGHPGSMTTIHADSPDRAVEQLALLVLQTGSRLRRSDIIDYVLSIIDLFVQLDRTAEGRRISEVRLSSRLSSAGALVAAVE